MGESEPAKQYYSFHVGTRMRHQEQIDAVKDQIKPGLYGTYFRPFTLSYLLAYHKKLYEASKAAEAISAEQACYGAADPNPKKAEGLYSHFQHENFLQAQSASGF